MNQTGFIINGEIKLNQQTNQDEFYFYGLLVDEKNQGKKFIWKITGSLIYIFVKESKIEKYKNFFLLEENSSKFFHPNFDKEKCCKVFFKNREKLKNFIYNEPSLNLEDILEYDINFLNRFLADHGIKGYVDFLESGKLVNDILFFENISFQKKIEFSLPQLNMLSIDIETNHFSFDDFQSGQLYSVALYGNTWHHGKNKIFEKVLMIGEQNNYSEKVEYFKDKEDLLVRLTECVQIYNPHIFVGWNVVNFDFKFLILKYQKYNLKIDWGINRELLQYQEKNKFINITIPGRVIMEGIFLFKNFYSTKFDSYKLENVSQKVLATGKTIADDGQAKMKKIDQLFHENKEQLAIYNLQDTKLVYDLIQKTQLFKIEIYRYLLSGTFIEKLSSSLDILENLYLKILHENKVASFKKGNHTKTEINFNLQSFDADFFKNVVEYSFEEFTMAIICNYSIDPVAMKLARVDQKNIVFEKSIENIHYHSDISFLPKILIQLEKTLTQFQQQDKDNKFFF